MVNNKIKKGLSVLLALAMTVSGMGGYAPTEVNAAESATEGLSKEEALDSFGLVDDTEEKPDVYGENTVGPYGNAGALINPYYELLVSKSCFTGLGKENCYTQEFSYDLNTVTDDKGLGLMDSNAYATTQSYGTEKFGLKSVALDLDGDGKQERIAKAYVNGSESGSPLEFTVGKTVLQRGVGKRQVTELTESFSNPFYKADSWEFKRVRQRSYGAGVSLASGDFDGDEKDEVALVAGNSLYVYDIEVNSKGEAYISNTKSIETPYQNRGSSGIEYVAVSLNTGDMNGDGVDELIVSQRDMVVIYSAQAAATAADGSMTPGGISTMKSVFSNVIRPCENADSATAKVLRLNAVYGDADGDGRDELIFAYNDTNTNLLKKSFLAAGYFTYKSGGNTGKFGQFTLTKNAPVYDNNGTDIYYFTRTLKSGSAEKSNGIEAKSWDNRNKLINGTDTRSEEHNV